MIVQNVVLLAPDASYVDLGVWSQDASGGRYGYTLETWELSPAGFGVEVQPLPYTTGALVTNGRRRERNIRLAGTIVGRTDVEVNELRRALVGVLRDWGSDTLSVRFNPEGTPVELRATVREATFRTQDGLVRYDVELVAGDPVAYALTDTVVTLSAHPGTLTTHEGDADVWPEFEVEVLTGTPTAIRVGNSTTGEYVELSSLVTAAGEVIAVTTKPGEERVTKDGVTQMNRRTAASRWPRIQPGANRLYVTVTAGGGTVGGSATYRAGWVS